MNNKNTLTFQVCVPNERQIIVDFLWSMWEEFLFIEQGIVEDVVQLLFDKGGMIADYANDGDAHTMIGLFGYFLGEPSQAYVNKEVGFIYIAGIARSYRRTGVFRNAFILFACLALNGP